jgi:periplasmic protein TonB
MRWSFWPVSITVHVVLGVAAFVVPLVADVTPPTPAPIRMFLPATKTVPVPDIVVAQAPPVHTPRVAPSVVAPVGIAPERKIEEQPYTGPAIPDLSATSGIGDSSITGLGPVATNVAPPPPPAPKPAQTLIRAGQGVREPKRISGSPPEYPAVPREAKLEGVVILEAVINERGEVGRIRVLHSAPLFDRAAITAVEQWRYTPTLLNGVPVSVLMTITVNFTLHD